ncbi:hypothetical protein SAMN05444008_12328 [Cnuella takakiae]|uniref:Uncharacterized protein n=1 Tax=Cnuella takakiae TaxID=1302690 RepID=A0A1M5ICK5_9BACT|nr:hypothetical protein SAMN05444008_12328 [Cnuella takakiae]
MLNSFQHPFCIRSPYKCKEMLACVSMTETMNPTFHFMRRERIIPHILISHSQYPIPNSQYLITNPPPCFTLALLYGTTHP